MTPNSPLRDVSLTPSKVWIPLLRSAPGTSSSVLETSHSDIGRSLPATIAANELLPILVAYSPRGSAPAVAAVTRAVSPRRSRIAALCVQRSRLHFEHHDHGRVVVPRLFSTTRPRSNASTTDAADEHRLVSVISRPDDLRHIATMPAYWSLPSWRCEPTRSPGRRHQRYSLGLCHRRPGGWASAILAAWHGRT